MRNGLIVAASSATERYPVRSYEVDSRGRLTVTALCDYLQESAGLHARALGVSVEQLLTRGMTWFLWRLHLRVDHLPGWGETVAIETWPAELGKPFAIRDFRLHVDDREIGVATTAWLLMDVAAKRPIRRLPERIRVLHPEEPQRALPDRFCRLPACAEDAPRRRITVRRTDLDLNAHLNHVAAIDALLEVVPAEIYDERRIESLEVEFRGEGSYRDVLESRCASDGEAGGTLLHGLTREADGKEVARGRSRWR